MRARKRNIMVLVAILGLAVIVSFSGCQFMDQLKARDLLNKGVADFTAKRYEEAAARFQEAIELDPELKDAYLYLATTYRAEFVPFAQSPENLQKGQQAIDTFEKVLEMEPNNTNAIISIAGIHRDRNDPEEAKEWFHRLMEIPDTKADALYNIASINYNLVDDATGKDGENIENLTEEELAETEGLVNEAIESLKEALDIKPDHTDAMEYLNLFYREKAELAEDEEEKDRWETEADKLALQAVEVARQKKIEEERARRQIFEAEQGAEGEGE